MSDKTITLPVTKLSYSAMTQLLRNPIMFKFKYILNVYDGLMSVSGMVGRGCHEALKVYYGGGPDDVLVPVDRDEAIGVAREWGLKYLEEYPDSGINFGKTGSREEMLKRYARTMDFYFKEEPEYHEIIMCEKKMDAEIKTMDGDVLPLPAVCVPDLVVRNADGTIDIIDTKFVGSYTDHDNEDYIKIIQAMFLFHVLLANNVKADRVLFREVKTSENKDGTDQIRDYAIPCDHSPYHMIFYNLYRDVVKYLSNDPVFLPNLSDPFDGEQAGLIYAQGLISSDMSDVEVMHKVRDVAFTSKKFVTSRLDNAENTHLLPEERVRIRLAEFGIPVVPQETQVGVSVTQYRFKVSSGVRMSTIKKHKDDIALALAVRGDIRILAPIPGTSMIGVEVENETRTVAKLVDYDVLEPMTLSVPIGIDLLGNIVKCYLDQMPHLLVAGTTGSGKSKFLEVLIKSLSQQLPASLLRLVLIDPKRVEFSKFHGLSHLMSPIIYEYEETLHMLYQLTVEMEKRYELLQASGKSNIAEFNDSKRNKSNCLPFIVVVVDEFADLIFRSKEEEKKPKGLAYSSWTIGDLQSMASSRKIDITDMTKKNLIDVLIKNDDETPERKAMTMTVEGLITRLAQMGRAAGIHLVIATQQPVVKVVTGIIKANFPTRISFMVTSEINSKVVLDQSGAEDLVGKGDMLFLDPKVKGLQRLQGFLSN